MIHAGGTNSESKSSRTFTIREEKRNGCVDSIWHSRLTQFSKLTLHLVPAVEYS